MIGMGEEEFWACTPRYFAARQEAYVERNKRDMEALRLSTYKICYPYLNRGSTLKRFWPMPWDKTSATVFEPADPVELKKFEDEAKLIFQNMGIQFDA